MSEMRLLVIGYGRMGKLVDQLSESYGFEVAGRLDIDDNRCGAGITADRVRDVDVAIDFSAADACATRRSPSYERSPKQRA